MLEELLKTELTAFTIDNSKFAKYCIVAGAGVGCRGDGCSGQCG